MSTFPRVSAARFELALDRLKSSDWERFERLCSVFVAADFPGARTMASPGGDRGRDAELYTVRGEPNTLFQFAVRQDWPSKIAETLKRLASEFPAVTSIVFLSSQQIGAKGDAIRKRAREQGIALDIRDSSWFIERIDTDDARNSAAAELARVVVDPFLTDSGIIPGTPSLDGTEAKTALVFLELQAKDDDTAKGFTKACYESLVKAALQGTTAEKRKSRSDVRNFVSGLLPQHNAAQLAPFVDGALKRLERTAVKHHAKFDEFHLAHEEVERNKDRVAGLTLLQDAFSSDAGDVAGLTAGDDPELVRQSISLLRTIIESYFYRLGEEFAQSVAGDREIPLHSDLLRSVTLEMAPTGRVVPSTSWADFLYSAATSLIASPSPETLELFRVLSTAYTLFAFLSEVPDVQRATKKLFEHGTLWFDTTVLLPLFAEQAFPDDMRPFTDSAAWRLHAKLSSQAADVIKHSPVMSLDFLIKYLSFGPRRDRVEAVGKGHSRVFTSTIYESIPTDLIKAATEVRQSCHGLSERMVQRRVRDKLDRRKMSAGAVQEGGLEGLDAALESMF